MLRARYFFSLFTVAILTGLASTVAISADPKAPSNDEGSVWWNELVSVNPERSRDFYASVIGWTPKIVAAEDNSRAPASGEAEYTIFTQNGTEAAGLSKNDGNEPTNPKPGWLTYIQVSSVDDAVVNALKKGGKVLKAPYNIANTGRLAVIEDIDGNAVGLFNPPAKVQPQ